MNSIQDIQTAYHLVQDIIRDSTSVVSEAYGEKWNELDTLQKARQIRKACVSEEDTADTIRRLFNEDELAEGRDFIRQLQSRARSTGTV